MPFRYPAEFRRKVLDLVAAGRPVAQVAEDLGVTAQTIYNWRRQELIDTGQEPGLSSVERAELREARRRIKELETELAVTRRANELLKEQVAFPKGGSRRSG
jgi:transposase-like protein